jgi:hypothetical protein
MTCVTRAARVRSGWREPVTLAKCTSCASASSSTHTNRVNGRIVSASIMLDGILVTGLCGIIAVILVYVFHR